MKMWWIIFGIIPGLEALYFSDVLRICIDVCQCEDFITDCRYNGLADLPYGIDPNTVSLDLSYNTLEHMPSTLKNLTNLKYLNLSHNKITTLGHSDFDGLSNLERLDFTFNLFHDWKDIHSESFAHLKKLTYLDMSSNPLRSIPQLSRHLNIPSLQILKLNNCSMRSIPVQVFNQLVNLKELHLTKNPVTNLNDSFKLDGLKYIDLSYSALNFIGENVFAQLSVLETLIIRQNYFLKRFLCNSGSLLYLDLSSCTLETIPSGNMRSLTTLNMQGNFLRYIPDNSFTNFPNLLTLNLSYNAIAYIESNAFRNLINVNVLDISLNKLTTLGENLFTPLVSLQNLNLSHNYISSINSITSNSLMHLDLSYCEIYNVDRYSLENLPKLMYLSLARNFLSFLPDGWVADRLVFLDLSGCRIKTIDNKTFEQMFYLRNINLSGNRLTTIDPTFFPQAIYVKIEDNQWRCDCVKLKHMYDWLLEYGERVNSLVCDSPEQHQGKTWQMACQDEWYPTLNRKEHLWWYSVGIIIAMVLLLVAVVIIRKVHQVKEDRIREAEETRRQHEREALERMRMLQREAREEISRNAPDPREGQRPPSYNEALRLPRFDTSMQNLSTSLHSIASRRSEEGSNTDLNKKTRVRRKRRRRKSNSSEGRRASQVDSDSSDQVPTPRTQLPLESDF